MFLSRRPHDPLVPPKNPFESFLLALSLASAIPLCLGAGTSQALEDRLTQPAVEAWGWSLLIGSLIAMIGLFAPARWRFEGLLLERAGLILVCGAATIYTTAILSFAADLDTVRYAAAVQIAYAAACFWRCVQITALMRWFRIHQARDDKEG